jgi:ubiquinone/menaquinone biosynthesis C-methylase UbiE
MAAVDRPDTRAIWEANAPAWIELSRAGYDVCRDLVNTPTFLQVLGPVDGRRCLDLGCGEGHNTRLLAERGADVVALDISETFLQAAADADDGRGIRYALGDGAELPFGTGTFDLVTAFMSLMDVADPDRTLHEVARVLRPAGTVQFSVLHPVTSSPVRRWVDDGRGRREALAIGGYFREGHVEEQWTFGAAPLEVQEQHRTFEITYARRTVAGWCNAVLAAGLTITHVAEPHADDATAAAHPEVADTAIAPYFLRLQAQKR